MFKSIINYFAKRYAKRAQKRFVAESTKKLEEFARKREEVREFWEKEIRTYLWGIKAKKKITDIHARKLISRKYGHTLSKLNLRFSLQSGWVKVSPIPTKR